MKTIFAPNRVCWTPTGRGGFSFEDKEENSLEQNEGQSFRSPNLRDHRTSVGSAKL